MLVKVKRAANKWMLFDNAEQVEFSGYAQNISSTSELRFKESERSDIVVINLLPSRIVVGTRIGEISFLRDGLINAIYFDTLAYICNDSGKTVEKVSVTTGV